MTMRDLDYVLNQTVAVVSEESLRAFDEFDKLHGTKIW